MFAALVEAQGGTPADATELDAVFTKAVRRLRRAYSPSFALTSPPDQHVSSFINYLREEQSEAVQVIFSHRVLRKYQKTAQQLMDICGERMTGIDLSSVGKESAVGTIEAPDSLALEVEPVALCSSDEDLISQLHGVIRRVEKRKSRDGKQAFTAEGERVFTRV